MSLRRVDYVFILIFLIFLLGGTGNVVSQTREADVLSMIIEASKEEASVGMLVSTVRRMEVKSPYLMVTTKVDTRGYVPVEGGILAQVMRRPVRVTSQPGWRASFGRMHRGTDVACNIGDTIYAPFEGVVKCVSYEAKGYGRYIVLGHDGDMETRYAHLLNSLVEPEEVVVRGQPIGLAGNSGNSTGPHLHFEFRPAGTTGTKGKLGSTGTTGTKGGKSSRL